MRRIPLPPVACLAITLLPLAQCLAAEARPMRFLDVLEFRSVSQGSLARDGKLFAYTQSSLDWKAGKRYTDIYLSSPGGAVGRQMTFTETKNESHPSLSPGGRWLAFLSDRDGGDQLYLMEVSGGEARKLTAIEGGVASYAFSRDGKWIALSGGRSRMRRLYLYDVEAASLGPPLKHDTGIASFAWAPGGESLFFIAPDREDAPERRRMELKFDVRIANAPQPARHLWRFDIGAGKAVRLTEGADFSVRSFLVSPDGRYLTFTSAPLDRYADSRGHEAWLLPLATRRPERLTTNQTPESPAEVSPDGRWVCFTAPEGFAQFRRERLYLRATGGGAWKVLPEGWEGDVESPEWSADGSRLYFRGGVGVGRELYELPVGGTEPRQVTRHDAYLTPRYDRDTGLIVFEFEDPSSPSDYYLATPAEAAERSRWRRLSDANPQSKDFALGAYETVRWKSSDGVTVEGVLVKPVHFEEGKRYPLIVQIHGGPAGASVRRFSSSYGSYHHVFAAGGYAVFQPNYRGSSNYGEKFRMAIAGDYFRQAFDDIMAGVDELIRRGIADPDQLGMMGWSAGGHWSNYTLTRTDRFKAISSGAGAVNWISLYAQTDVQSNREFYFKGKPWENWDHYVEVSPLRYITKAKTPTLIHVGENDARVPKPQSDELHMALKKLGVPTEYIVYPRMGHGITDPRYQMVKMVAEYNWFEKWIRGKPGWLDWNEILDTVSPANKENKRQESGQ